MLVESWFVGSRFIRSCNCSVYSRSKAGQSYADVVPEFLGFVSLELESIPLEFTDLDVLFLATPHGATAELVPLTKGIPIVVDLSRDHRHVAGWIYAQPEWRKSDIIGASRIAAPGCFATAISLGVAPLVSEGVLTGPIRVCAATGSTGSGATPKATTHHPERMTNIRAYKVFTPACARNRRISSGWYRATIDFVPVVLRLTGYICHHLCRCSSRD